MGTANRNGRWSLVRATCSVLENLEPRRLFAAGSLDTTFGTGGVVLTDVNSSTDDRARDVIVQADGNIDVGSRAGSNLTNTGQQKGGHY